jgi:hypothetical protein
VPPGWRSGGSGWRRRPIRVRDLDGGPPERRAATNSAFSPLIGTATVKTHVSSILTKLGLRDRAQVVIFAYESGPVRVGDHGIGH